MSRVVRLLERFGMRKKGNAFPRKITLRTFIPKGCRFEITSPMESFRVEQFGDEREFTQRIIDDIRPADVVYDIGACVGMVCLHAAQKAAFVVAFEPDLAYRTRLIRNQKLNKIRNIQIVEWAVSDRQGEAVLFTDGVEGWSPSFLAVGKHHSVVVPTRSIDLALEAGDIPWPSIVKLDIEGAEILALRGMQKLLSSSSAPRLLFIEIHPDYLPQFNASPEEVEAIIAGCGYVEAYKQVRSAQMHCVFRKRAP